MAIFRIYDSRNWCLRVQYGTQEYWNERYSRSTSHFEWYEGYQPLRSLLHDFAPRDQSLLQVQHTYSASEEAGFSGFHFVAWVSSSMTKSIPRVSSDKYSLVSCFASCCSGQVLYSANELKLYICGRLALALQKYSLRWPGMAIVA